MSRLAIVRQKYNPAGGAERIVSAILGQLKLQDELEPVLINRNWEQLDGVTVCRVNPFYLGSIWRDWSFARAARRAWQRMRADLVLSHERIPGCNVYRADDGVHAAWLDTRKKKYGFKARVAVFLNPFHLYMRQVERRMYSHPDFRGVICISEMVRRDVIDFIGLPSEKCHVIYNGIDTQRFNPRDARRNRERMRAELNIAADVPVMVFVGSGFNRKGLYQAIELIAQFPDVRLIVVGSDKKINWYRKVAIKFGVDARVYFVGSKSNVIDYYGMSDAFILPSVYEPFGLVIAEAMACGLPVFVSNRCGGAELVQENKTGWIASVTDHEQWVVNVKRWLDIKDHWYDLSIEVRESVLKFTEEKMVMEMIALFHELNKS
ncbi:UDP-glucose:(heptosyl)LPS alpha-1,3-glucosyltransferase [Aquitalea magnusonii]|uniref:UDP-glucose:(Heptosyl)LPS alpha-1,3-glucosyltransferase n=2 Tax=Aquitalea magnusonii TaxID=332411 RepID=A0A318JBD5_9NEIS|nr:glycosyltransferase family 4 protein [Aquitalea magnusonii]PXX45971.1 UDP-glucose:(heptosyl)LPS alpha-1,3-glucosyltransferase [Aquitalea magnusonii]